MHGSKWAVGIVFANAETREAAVERILAVSGVAHIAFDRR
jgi:hypothetical protein